MTQFAKENIPKKCLKMCPKKYPKMQLFGCRVNRIQRPSLTKKIYQKLSQKLSQNPILWMQGKSYSMTQFAKEN